MYVREDLYICTCICVSYSLIVFTACGANKHFLCAYSICVCGVFFSASSGRWFWCSYNIYIDKIWFIDKESMVYFSIIKISLSHNRTSISYGLRNFAIIKPMTVFSFINRPSKLYIKHASNVEKWTTWLPLCSGSIVLAC